MNTIGLQNIYDLQIVMVVMLSLIALALIIILIELIYIGGNQK